MRQKLIFSVFLLLSLVAKSQDKAVFADARSHYNNAQYGDALIALNQITETDEATFDVWLLKGDCYQKEEKFPEAIQAYQKAEKLNNESALLYANWASALYNIKEIDEGEKKAKEALKLDRDLPEANYFMGNIKHHEYNLLSALKYYNKAIKLQPDYRDALYMRAATYAELGNYSKALKDYEKVLAIDPNLSQAKYNIGVIQVATESYAAAARTFEELNPENLPKPIDFYFYQAESLYFAGEKDEACLLYEKAKNLGDTESAEIYEKYCVNKEERLEPAGKTRTIRATF